MNIQHSCATDAWGTPIDIIERSRIVLGSIDLDPASDWRFNHNVKAKYHITKEEDGLKKPWPSECSIFLNPPGGKTGRDSNTVLFWERLMHYRKDAFFKHAIFLAFSLEALQTTQKIDPPIAAFPICIPRKRLQFITPEGLTGAAPSHSNVIVYVPGSVDRTHEFVEEFCDLGYIKV